MLHPANKYASAVSLILSCALAKRTIHHKPLRRIWKLSFNPALSALVQIQEPSRAYSMTSTLRAICFYLLYFFLIIKCRVRWIISLQRSLSFAFPFSLSALYDGCLFGLFIFLHVLSAISNNCSSKQNLNFARVAGQNIDDRTRLLIIAWSASGMRNNFLIRPPPRVSA